MPKSILRLGFILLMTFAPLPHAFAAPITYTLTGYVQGTVGSQNVNAGFTLTVNADTDGITAGSGLYLNPAITSFLTINGVTSNLPLANVTVAAAISGVVNIGSTSAGLGLNSPAVKAWNLGTPIGPLIGSNFLVKGALTGTDGTVITLTGVVQPAGSASPSFQASISGGGSVVVPNTNATVTGDDTGGLPSPPKSNLELQSLYDSGQFPAQPIYITGFTTRAAPGGGPISLTVGGNIFLSTSPNYPNTNGGHTLMSTTFANNVGPDATLVLSSNSFTSNGVGCTAPGPCPFATNIAFTTPFLYNPAKGPLLLDAKVTSIGGTGLFDSIDCNAPGCSTAGVNGSLGSPTGDFSYGGDITQLTYTTLPFFNGDVPLGSNVYYLQFPNSNLFGYFNLQSFPLFYHYDMGFESFIDGGNGAAYMFDFTSGHWFYTNTSLFPYLYDFTLENWLYYFPDTNNPGHYTTNPRYFSNLTTGQIITQ